MYLHLLFRVLVGVDRVVDVFHCPLNEVDRVRPPGLGVDTLLWNNGCNVPEHGLQLSLPLLVWHLEFPFGKNLSTRKTWRRTGLRWAQIDRHSRVPYQKVLKGMRFVTCLQISVRSSVPNAFVRSSFLATWPLDTFTKTECVCKTSSRSFSLESHKSVHIKN